METSNTCNTTAKGKTGQTKHTGHTMNNAIVTLDSGTGI